MPETTSTLRRARGLPVLALALALPLSLLGGQAEAASAVVQTPQVRAELVAHAPQGVAVGQPLWLALKIEHQPHWHTYWKNPGDSGLPTTFAWTLPAGLQPQAVQWPTPQRLPIGPLMNFGYEGTLLLATPVQVQQAPAGETLTVKLRADWLVCKDVCIPEGGDFQLDVPTRAASASQTALFERTQAALPRQLPALQAQARVDGAELVVEAGPLPPAWVGQKLQFFPETPGLIQNAAVPQERWAGDRWSARIPLDPQRSEGPAVLPALLVRDGEPGLAMNVAVATPWPAVAAAAVPAPVLGNAEVLPPRAPTAGSLAAVLAAALAALAGGVLLNLMPCVFPVLSLKVLGFASHAHERRALVVGGLAYTAGVVASFLALAALMLSLRAAGEQLGWGFQLQSPTVVAALAVLFTLIGLNLAGVFEFGTALPSSWAAARARHPAADAALTGVLAVAVASPCTAPFMGAALGAAVTWPAWQALLVFGALGLGMALPYLLASLWPGFAARLPRPGVWMLHVKTVMAFPMFATVVWLVWVLGQQTGIHAVAGLLGWLVVLALAAWVWGAAGMGRRTRAVLGGAAVVLLAAATGWAWPLLQAPAPAASGSAAAPPDADGWQPWSAERVAQAQAAGQPVFVDFTAAWCVTCQFNKRTALADADVKADFQRKRVLLLRADWTRRDAAISAELTRLQRSGVPVYALYTPGAPGPTLLSEILTVAALRQSLAALPDPS